MKNADRIPAYTHLEDFEMSPRLTKLLRNEGFFPDGTIADLQHRIEDLKKVRGFGAKMLKEAQALIALAPPLTVEEVLKELESARDYTKIVELDLRNARVKIGTLEDALDDTNRFGGELARLILQLPLAVVANSDFHDIGRYAIELREQVRANRRIK